MGLQEEDMSTVVDETGLSRSQIIGQSFLPKWAGRGIEQNFFDFFKIGMKAKDQAKKVAGRPPLIEKSDDIGMTNVHGFMNQDVIRRGELPSANFHASARGILHMSCYLFHCGRSLFFRVLRLRRNTHGLLITSFDSLLSRAGLEHLGKGWTVRGTTTRRVPYLAQKGSSTQNWNRSGHLT